MMTIGNMSGYRKPVKVEPSQHGGFVVSNSESGGLVAHLDSATPKGQAHDIATLVAAARDYGFQLGLASVRTALGFKE